MKMRNAVLAAAMFVAACGVPPSVVVPQTPEGQNCVRQCMTVENTCRLGLSCDQQWHDCLMTCPGAQEQK